MQVELLNINPTIGFIDQFLKKEHFAQLTEDLAILATKDAKILGKQDSRKSKHRIAQSARIPQGHFTSVDAAKASVAKLFNLKSEYCERAVLIHYEPGGEYKPHVDAGPSGKMPPKMLSARKGDQRVFTGVLYLNDNFDGGETKFPRLKLEIAPKAGRLAFWQNTLAGERFPDPLSLHQGCPVTRGHKRILTFWFRGRPQPEISGPAS